MWFAPITIWIHSDLWLMSYEIKKVTLAEWLNVNDIYMIKGGTDAKQIITKYFFKEIMFLIPLKLYEFLGMKAPLKIVSKSMSQQKVWK
jgi:hypothetical protein